MAKQALEGQRLNAFGMDPNVLVIIGYDTKDGPEHALWDERMCPPRLAEEDIRNIKLLGVQEPVLVRKDGERVVVIDGRHRVLWCRAANARLREEGASKDQLHLVPCIVKRGDDAKVMGLMAALNEVAVRDSPIVRARKAQRLLDRNQSEDHVATIFGISVVELRRLLKLLDLDDQVQGLVATRQIASSTALTLLDLPREEQAQKAQEYVQSGVTVEEAKQQTKARKNGNGGENGGVHLGKIPSKAVLKKLVADDEFVGGLEVQARALLKWLATGDENQISRVRGLTAKLEALRNGGE